MTDKITDGGPAFPTADFVGEGETTKWFLPQGGMTLRDYFAAAALQGMLRDYSIANTVNSANPHAGLMRSPEAEHFAKAALGIADAMIKLRTIKTEGETKP